jgi:hypothetical protein
LWINNVVPSLAGEGHFFVPLHLPIDCSAVRYSAFPKEGIVVEDALAGIEAAKVAPKERFSSY